MSWVAMSPSPSRVQMAGGIGAPVEYADDLDRVAKDPVVENMLFDDACPATRKVVEPRCPDLGEESQIRDGSREDRIIAITLRFTPCLPGVKEDVREIVLGVGRDNDRPSMG
jgi:hypothetical protein